MYMAISGGLGSVDTKKGFDVVERKGIGHPDSLADLIAEEFSRRYSLLGLKRFGAVPNHWVDKVALVGAESVVGFGRYSIEKSVSAYLFGKVTRSVGDERIPIDDLFREVAEDVLRTATRSPHILDHLRIRVENTAGIGADHPFSFYRPDSAADCSEKEHGRQANDTAFCSAYAPVDPLDALAIDLENHITDLAFTEVFPMVGTDVKVMIVRAGMVLDLTVCIPVHPDLTDSHRTYKDVMIRAREHLEVFVENHPVIQRHPWQTRVSLNTKDHGQGAYLAPFGTSLGKGDCGLVGRGNKANGVISANRGAGVEALAGKNPVHHTGKLYTLAAIRIANQIFADLGLPNETVLVSRNGDPLSKPSFVGVRLARQAGDQDRRGITDIVGSCLAELGRLSKRLLMTDPIERFRNPALILEG
ncbi:S-adenosylmethionine synthetase [Spinactinospora alkalitolerans]|uniref:S-adenosylmethionine synthetase n=1 Tax=Spinactinospora alkalitolerans TaxID=687207 RepID=A0A852TYA1_9ACTN|nr:methionine adenosyltransferase [Spinactinospora alkalitolerans]NYE48315.1 S-adenosylmethionine synthetase [Spinactinospora alkalitolerans]